MNLRPEKSQALTGFEPMTSVISVRFSANWELVPAKSWSLCEFVTYSHIHHLSYLSLQFKYMILHNCNCTRDIFIWRAIVSFVLERFVSTSQLYTFLLDSLIQKEVKMLSFISFLGERTEGAYKQERYENDDYLHKAWKQDFYDSINDYYSHINWQLS